MTWVSITANIVFVVGCVAYIAYLDRMIIKIHDELAAIQRFMSMQREVNRLMLDNLKRKDH